MLINSQISYGTLLSNADTNRIKNEPMLHRATRDFAFKNGGQLTKQFLNSLQWEEDILIDSRVHMLMPGMFPCIPGWHHDDVPRERSDKQPEYINPSYKAEHCLAIWGGCSRTEFAVGTHEFYPAPTGRKIYKEANYLVEDLCDTGILKRIEIPDNQLVFFDWMSWHRGMEATERGFRFFIRATRYSKLSARNEVRINSNVYMPIPEEGW